MHVAESLTQPSSLNAAWFLPVAGGLSVTILLLVAYAGYRYKYSDDFEDENYELVVGKEKYDSEQSDNSSIQNSVMHEPLLKTSLVRPGARPLTKEVSQKLWCSLQEHIPGCQWVEARMEQHDLVQWICLGPDYRYFIATAYVVNEGSTWKWDFREFV